MKNRMASIGVLTVASILMILLTTMLVSPARAASADAMWVDPPTMTLNQSSIGTTFNVTVSMNITENVYAYQVGIHYNRTLLTCTRVGFTGGLTSSYFSGHTTTPAGPLIDGTSLGNGSVLVGESLVGTSDMIAGPNSASLVWIEFLVLNFTPFLPTSGNLTAKFDLTTETPNPPGNNYVLDENLNTLTVSPFNSTVTFAPEFAYLLLLPIFIASTLAATIFSRRRQKKLK